MISDVAPAWCLLAAVAGLGLVRSFPQDRVVFGGRFSPRVFVSASLIFSLVLGTAYFLPQYVYSYGKTHAPPPSAPTTEVPTLVFVHGPWDARIVARLLGNGMRADSVSAGMTLNSTCSMQEFADAVAGTGGRGATESIPQVSFTYGVTDGSARVRLPNGSVVRTRPDEELTPACSIQTHSDRGGTVPLMPLLWQGVMPGTLEAGAMYARDLGPTENARLIARYPRRRVMVLLHRPDDGNLAILPYETGMELLWGGEPSEDDGR